MDWREYQEKAAEFFRSLGLEANTDITISGARTKHDIDVLVKSHHAGFNITWIVECKYWKSKVSKLHVLALREIVQDTGTDRGFILAENGFQSGAIEAAALTNVHVTSLAEAANTASHQILSMQMRDLYDRLLLCKDEYWDIPKCLRIKSGLRPDTYECSYTGYWAISTAENLLIKGLRGHYPIALDDIEVITSPALINQTIPNEIPSPKVLTAIVKSIVEELEDRIGRCKTNNNLDDKEINKNVRKKLPQKSPNKNKAETEEKETAMSGEPHPGAMD